MFQNLHVLSGIIFLKRHTCRVYLEKLNDFRTKFSTDPDFRGAYSSRSIKTEQLQTGAKDLAQPVLDSTGKPVVLFAGEATSPQHWSTLHGAIETGWREADRLIEIYKK